MRTCPTSLVLSLAAALCASLGCQAREPASVEARPAPADADVSAPAAPKPADKAGHEAGDEAGDGGKLEAADLVHVELGRVPDAAREALAARLGPESPLAGAGALIAVHYQIAPQWHIYWVNPGESGLRTRIDGEAEGARLGQTLYPAPERIVAEGGQVSYGWGDAATLFVPLRTLDADSSLTLRTRYLVCRESCISGEVELDAELSALELREDELTTAMLARVPEPAGERVEASWNDAGNQLRLRGGAEVELAELFPYASNAALLEAQAVEADTLELRYRFTSAPEAPAQGVLRVTIAGAPRWLELAVPWPATTPS